jgi:Fur family ferric uptake transcriptional regulator
VEEGWLVTVELPGAPPRYELSGKEHHHHFHCQDCGKMYELEGCVDNLKKMTPDGFRLTGHDVILFGLCAACMRVVARGRSG